MQTQPPPRFKYAETVNQSVIYDAYVKYEELKEQQDDDCLLYTSPSPRDGLLSRMPSSA